jgi:hypothetical protein
VERLDVVPALGKPALFSVFTLVKDGGAGAICVRDCNFVARDAHGRRTGEALALRRFFDLPAAEHEAPSPRRRPRGQPARS